MVQILHEFLFDDATVTASSADTDFPAENAIHDFVAKVWRSTSDTGQWLKFDLGTARQITMLAIFGHSLTSGATITLEAHTADSWGTPAYSQELTWHEQAIVLFLSQTYRWWRITFEDSSNPDEYIEIGRVCAGVCYEPTINVAQDVQIKLIDPSTIQESEGRQGYVIERDVYRELSVQFTDIPRTQQEELIAIFRNVKNIRPLVFALDPDDYPEADTIYGMITSPLTQALRALKYGDVPISIEEKVA